jgi:hypothetical protein
MKHHLHHFLYLQYRAKTIILRGRTAIMFTLRILENPLQIGLTEKKNLLRRGRNTLQCRTKSGREQHQQKGHTFETEVSQDQMMTFSYTIPRLTNVPEWEMVRVGMEQQEKV